MTRRVRSAAGRRDVLTVYFGAPLSNARPASGVCRPRETQMLWRRQACMNWYDARPAVFKVRSIAAVPRRECSRPRAATGCYCAESGLRAMSPRTQRKAIAEPACIIHEVIQALRGRCTRPPCDAGTAEVQKNRRRFADCMGTVDARRPVGNCVHCSERRVHLFVAR